MKWNYFVIPLLVAAVAAVGGQFTRVGLPWYDSANIPGFAPSGVVIGTVWTILYGLAAIALIWFWNRRNKKHTEDGAILWLAIANGILNSLWSYLFFARQAVALAIGEMVVLELTVLGLIWLMWKHYRVSAWLLVPYAIWVGFATYLAYSFWLLNR